MKILEPLFLASLLGGCDKLTHEMFSLFYDDAICYQKPPWLWPSIFENYEHIYMGQIIQE